MIKLYGIPQSRALRSLWMLEELGVEYELVPTHFIGDSKKPEYLALNPNGRVPTLVDGDAVIWESLAINLYLARKYDGGLQPKSELDQAHATQWSIWAMTELEPGLMECLLNRVMLPEEKRNPDAAEEAEKKLDRPFAVLDGVLAERSHLVGESFSVADLNVASVLAVAGLCQVDLSSHANLSRWLGECTARPALQRARG
jgi:glutathione S-transferase